MNQINNNSLNFQGKYLVKGEAKSVDRFFNLAFNKCYNKNDILFKPNNPNKFWEIESHNLMPIFSDNQYAECLFVTNNDFKQLQKFRKKNNPNPSEGLIKLGTPPEEAIEIIGKNLEQLHKKIQPYRDAVDKGLNNVNDFFIEHYQKGRKELSEIFGPKEAEKIKIIDVKDAFSAAKKNKFDFIEGNILE